MDQSLLIFRIWNNFRFCTSPVRCLFPFLFFIFYWKMCEVHSADPYNWIEHLLEHDIKLSWEKWKIRVKRKQRGRKKKNREREREWKGLGFNQSIYRINQGLTIKLCGHQSLVTVPAPVSVDVIKQMLKSEHLSFDDDL